MTQPPRRCPQCGDRLPADQRACLKCLREAARRRRQAPVSTQPVEAEARPSGRSWVGVAAAAIAIASLGGVAARFTRPSPPAPILAEAQSAAAPFESAVAAGYDPEPVLPAPVTSASSTTAQVAGFAEFQAGNYGSALARFQEAIDREPSSGDALNGAGQTLLQMGRAADAVPLLERAVEARPGDATFRFNLAVALERIGSLPSAVSEYERLAIQTPSDPRVFCNLGLALRRLGHDPEAIAALRKATELAPDQSSAWLALALSLDRQGQAEPAAAAFEQFLSLVPDSPDAPRIRDHIAQLRKPPGESK
jgi:Flp pilus assembly protein TadD